MPEFFLEIGTEEIPTSYIEPALAYLERELALFFSKNRIKAGQTTSMATPRRLVISISDIETQQADVVETHYGPSVKVAFDSEGNPTKAAQGFARGKGVDVALLTKETTPKGEVVCARVEQRGRPTEQILNACLPDFIANIPFPKKMRWRDKKIPFVRPMQWIVAIFDGNPLSFEFDGILSQEFSFGHRFLSPGRFKVLNLASYLEECEKHFLIVRPEERKKRILDEVKRLAGEVSGVVEDDPVLLNEVAYLVEYPVAIRGDFNSGFLELPKELLVMTMKRHQKFFPVFGKNGSLLPHFITISNIQSDSLEKIKHGNERVLRARLEDASFFFDEDRKKNLEDYVEDLKGVVFQKALGTSYEKMMRFLALSELLAHKVCPDKINKVQRAARLCKTDLVTQMVYEFPELQGIMGGYYAAHSGEDPEVVQAIKEHYSPSFSGDCPPSTPVGAVISIGDKLDTILGCIGVGLLPTGSEDPYGLRRHSLGIIQIILDRSWQVSFDELIEAGIRQLGDKKKLQADEIKARTVDLFSARFKSLLTEEGFPYDVIDAVLANGVDSPVDVKAKVKALSELKKRPHFEPLAIAFRRVVSILTEDAEGEVEADLLLEPAEKELYKQFLSIRDPVEKCIRNKQFSHALEKIVEIKNAVDDFFDNVMVMVKDNAVKKNRLHLLHQISKLFSQLADFSKIVLKKS